MKYLSIITTLFLLLVIPAVTLAADLDGYSFKKISAYDQKAVVKSPQGELQIVGPGDKLGEKISVKEITERGKKQGDAPALLH